MTRTRRRDPAAALILAMAALLILGVLGTVLGTAVLRGIAEGREAAARDSLMNIAESGVDLALSRLARDQSWAGGEAITVPGGECAVAVTKVGEGVYDITSRALAEPRAGRRGGVRVEAKKTPGGALALSAWRRVK